MQKIQVALQLFKLRGWSVQDVEDAHGDIVKSLVVPLDENGIDLWKDRYPVVTLNVTDRLALVPKLSKDVYQRLVDNGVIDPKEKRPTDYIGHIKKIPF